ncbi:MAG: CHAT domain-containing protein [Thiofilum sp.]|nr:CHAT domain-containing protein [Thiofilum sp.]
MAIVLLLGAAGKDQELKSVPKELALLKQRLIQSHLSYLQIEYEPYLTLSSLSELLQRCANQIEILHFAGHSNPSQILTNDEDLYSYQIATIIKTWKNKPKIIFLNGCENADQVEAFLNAGVKCVIATHKPISDKLASVFADSFYSNLLSNPHSVNCQQAFDRAGAIALLNQNNKLANTLDLKNLPDASSQFWDWGLFSHDTTWLHTWTVEQLMPKSIEIKNQDTQSKAFLLIGGVLLFVIVVLVLIIIFIPSQSIIHGNNGTIIKDIDSININNNKQ